MADQFWQDMTPRRIYVCTAVVHLKSIQSPLPTRLPCGRLPLPFSPSPSLYRWPCMPTGQPCALTWWGTRPLPMVSCCILLGAADGVVPDKRRSPLCASRGFASASSSWILIHRPLRSMAYGGIPLSFMSLMARKCAGPPGRKRSSP